MSFLKKLFGSKGRTSEAGTQSQPLIKGAEIDYNGFIIHATPFKESGQYQSCGIIMKEIDGVKHEHRFIRADRFSSAEDAVAMIHIKARQIIDEQGESLFPPVAGV